MLCNRCNKREATIHITKFINNNKAEIYLCDQCAKENSDIEDKDVLSFKNIISGILNPNISKVSNSNSQLKCKGCQMTYDDFRNRGQLGCSRCYETFKDKLYPLIKRIHGSDKHVGKIPEDEDKLLKVKRDIEELKIEMEVVIKDENFERAAELRDEIYALENKLGSE